jgi:hypothetical protein
MAGSMTDTAEVDILKILTGQAATGLLLGGTATSYTPFVGLFTAMPTDSAAGTEVASANAYARVTSVGKWGTPSAGSVANNAAITFPTATGSWGTAILGFGLFTASTAGTLVAYGTLTDQTKTVGNGDTVSFAIGALTITAD